jgi:hypothetical protein
MIALLLLVLGIASSMLVDITTLRAAPPCVVAVPGENLWRLTSQLGDCLNYIASDLDQCCSVLENSSPSLQSSVDQLISSTDFCCQEMLSGFDATISTIDNVEAVLSSKIDIVINELAILTGSTLDQIQSDLECIASNIDLVCSESECLITAFSILEALSASAIDNLSTIDQIFSSVVSAVDSSTTTLTSVIDSAQTTIISSLDTILTSEIDQCCSMLFSAIEGQSFALTSFVDTVFTSQIEACCEEMLSAIDATSMATLSAIDSSSTQIVSSFDTILTSDLDIFSSELSVLLTSIIDNTTGITASALDGLTTSICSCVDAAEAAIIAQLNTITGSTLEGITSKLEALDSGIDALCSDLECVVERFSLIDILSEQAVENLSDLDNIISGTSSNVDIILSILQDPTCGQVAVCNDVNTISTNVSTLTNDVNACCSYFMTTVNSCCNTVNNISNQVTTLTNDVENCCGMFTTMVNACCTTVDNINTAVGNIEACCEAVADGVAELSTALETCCEEITGLLLDPHFGLEAILGAVGEAIGLITDVLDGVEFIEGLLDNTAEQTLDNTNTIKDETSQILSITEELSSVVSSVDTLACLVGTPITTAPITITTSGTYVLCDDLATAGIAITITANNVDLDLNNHRILADTGIIISPSQADITIHNGRIDADVVGITAVNDKDITIYNIDVLNAPAFVFNTCQYIVVENCTAILDSTTTPVVLPNSAMFYFTDSLDIVVNNCFATGTELLGGFSFVGATAGVTVENSVASGSTTSTVTGFFVDSSVRAIFLNNCTSLTAQTGFQIQATSGIQAENCIADNNQTGFTVDTFSAKNLLIGCTARNNTAPAAAGIGFNILGSNNLLERCCAFQNNTDIFIDVTAVNTQILDTCANTITNNSTTTTILNLGTVNSTVDLIAATLKCSVGTLITQANIGAGAVGYTISAPGTYILCGDLVGFLTNQTVITIASNNVILDLNGFNINGVLGPVPTAISVKNFSDIEIKNGTISDFDIIDINIIDCTNVLVQDIAITGDSTDSTKINVNQCSDITIYNCSIQSGGGQCVSVTNASTNVVVDNCEGVSDDAFPAIFESNGTGSITYKNSTASAFDTGATTGFSSTGDTDVAITGCVTSGLQTGYNVTGAIRFTIADSTALNVVAGGLGGFFVTGPAAANGTISNSSAQAASTPGFTINTVNNVTLENCTTTNTAGGFVLSTINNLIVDSCQANLSTAQGFLCTNLNQTEFINCAVNSSSQLAYSFVGGAKLTLEGCIANNPSVGGITLSGTTDAVLHDCAVVRSSASGIVLTNSASRCELQNCVVNGATGDGYSVFTSSSIITFTGCKALNVGRGFDIENTSAIILDDCTVDTTNTAEGFLISNVTDVVYDGCTAMSCATNGFTAVTGSDVLYRTCIANGNIAVGAAGFSLTNEVNVLFCQCVSHGNTTGIFISSNCTDIKIIETCIGGNGTDIVNNAGTQTDFLNIETIESLIEALNFQVSSVSDVLSSQLDILTGSGCANIITQANIGVGGTYTITVPGHYCLAETVTYSTGTAITINSRDVILDLNNNAIIRSSGNLNPTTSGAIVVQGANEGVIIQNGIIDTDGILVSGTDAENGTIRNIKIVNTNNSICTVSGGTGINIQSPGWVVEDCEIYEVCGVGIIGAQFVQRCLVSGCGSDGFQIGVGLVTNCIASGNRGNGFTISGSTLNNAGTTLLYNSAISNVGYGFLATGIVGQAASGGSDDCPSFPAAGLANSFSITNSQGIRLAYNYGLDNRLGTSGVGGSQSNFVMQVNISDSDGFCMAGIVDVPILPPIGTINRIAGAQFWDLTFVVVGTLYGPLAYTNTASGTENANGLANIPGGNLDGNL